MNAILSSGFGLAALGLVLITGSCRARRETAGAPALPPVPVSVVAVRNNPRPSGEDVVGTVRAKLAARVESKVNGRIAQLLAAPGQAVKKGDTLIVIDAAEIQAKLDQASAVFAQAKKDFDRLKPLLANNAISQQDFDAADARLRVAKSSVAEAETMLGYTNITAPFDGVVTRKIADVGDFAMPGKSLLEMESPVALRFEADMPEALLDQIKIGDKLPVKLNALANSISATVTEMAPVADPGSRTFLVKLDLPKIDGVRAGQFGRVRVPVGPSNLPLVPASAVAIRGQMEFVMVVDEGRAHLRIVKTGKRLDGETEIVSGLQAGEKVITEGAARDGQRVEVKP
jgi:RND family efflux transporter MFP subunit